MVSSNDDARELQLPSMSCATNLWTPKLRLMMVFLSKEAKIYQSYTTSFTAPEN